MKVLLLIDGLGDSTQFFHSCNLPNLDRITEQATLGYFKSKGIPYAKGTNTRSKRHNDILNKFLEKHPSAEYFLLDGGHKSTAATLSHQPLPVLVIEKDSDFKEAHKLESEGELFGWYDRGDSIENTVKIKIVIQIINSASN